MCNDNNDIPVKRGRGRPKGSSEKRKLFLEALGSNRAEDIRGQMVKTEKKCRAKMLKLLEGEIVTEDLYNGNGGVIVAKGTVINEGVIANIPMDSLAYIPLREEKEEEISRRCGMFFRARKRQLDGLEELKKRYGGLESYEDILLGNANRFRHNRKHKVGC